MNNQYVVSFSGGRTSAYMLRRMMNEEPDATFHVVFANTGKEREETLEFVRKCSIRWNIPITWIEAKVNPEKGVGTDYTVVDFDTAARNGEPFTEVIKKYGIPGPSHPHCSRELKIVPIAKWVRDNVQGEYEMVIGIRYDEIDRLGDHYYPLVHWHVTKAVVRLFWKSQPFDLNLKDYEGNCDLCYKKSMNKKLTIIEQHPEKLEWWQNAEATYGKGHVMNRDHIPFTKYGEMVKRGKFRRTIDGEGKIPYNQQTLFDLELACTCGVPYPES